MKIVHQSTLMMPWVTPTRPSCLALAVVIALSGLLPDHGGLAFTRASAWRPDALQAQRIRGTQQECRVAIGRDADTCRSDNRPGSDRLGQTVLYSPRPRVSIPRPAALSLQPFLCQLRQDLLAANHPLLELWLDLGCRHALEALQFTFQPAHRPDQTLLSHSRGTVGRGILTHQCHRRTLSSFFQCKRLPCRCNRRLSPGHT